MSGSEAELRIVDYYVVDASVDDDDAAGNDGGNAGHHYFIRLC